MGVIFTEDRGGRRPASRVGKPATENRYAATNMGPKGFTDAQKAQINKRLKAKVIKST